MSAWVPEWLRGNQNVHAGIIYSAPNLETAQCRSTAKQTHRGVFLGQRIDKERALRDGPTDGLLSRRSSPCLRPGVETIWKGRGGCDSPRGDRLREVARGGDRSSLERGRQAAFCRDGEAPARSGPRLPGRLCRRAAHRTRALH